jgi:hypothetical protein
MGEKPVAAQAGTATPNTPRVLTEQIRDMAGTVTRHMTYLDGDGQIVRTIVVQQMPNRGDRLGVSRTTAGLLHIARTTNGTLTIERAINDRWERLEMERTPLGKINVFSLAPDGRRRLLNPAEHASTLQEVTLLTAALNSEPEWDE